MDHIQRPLRKVNPRETTNIFSRLTFFFTLKLFRKGFKQELEEEDLYEVLSIYRSKKLGDELENEWKKQSRKGQKISIFRVLLACYGWEYFMLGVMQITVKIIMMLIHPYALSKVVLYFTPGQTTLTKQHACYYAALLIGTNFTHSIYAHNYYLALAALGIKVRTAFSSFIYRKALKLSPSHLGDISIGKIVTLITKDVSAFDSFIYFANDTWIGIVKTIVMGYIIYRKIGVAAFAGIGFFVVFIPIEVYLGSWCTKLRTKLCKKSDERLQITQETLSAIKIIKMYTWEKIFNDKIDLARKKEIRSIHANYYLKFFILQSSYLNARIAFYLVIMTYYWLGNHITAEVVYFISSCFGIWIHTMTVLFPLAVTQGAELVASLKRIGNVLKALEVQVNPQTDEPTMKPKIILKGVTVNFKNKEILQSIELNIKVGLTLVTGPVGSGKSFLLKTILQEYEPVTGDVFTSGRVSFASQEPWLFPSSIKQNILFGEKYNEERYKEVLKVCALVYDFELLAAGDSTIVEDRGINLSKGQQARINLARAVYKESDIYLLDDCLSALDAHVSDFIFKKCIKKFLKNTLVILVSHNINHVKEVDNIIVMNNGRIKSNVKSSEISEKEILEDIQEEKEKGGKGEEYLDEEENANEEAKLITETTKERKVYQEVKKKGDVDFSVYGKYIRFGGGVLAFAAVFAVFCGSQFVHSYGDKLLSQWVNLEESITNITSSNYTNITNEEGNILKSRDFTRQLYTAMLILMAVLNLGRAMALYATARHASIKLHQCMIKQIINATMQFFDSNFIGNVLNRFSKDLQIIDDLIPAVIFYLTEAFLSIVGVVTLITTVQAFFLVPTIIFLVVLTIIRRLYLPTGRSLKRMEAATRSPVVGHLNATLEGLTTIRSSKAEQILCDEFDRHQDLNTSASYVFQCCLRGFAYALDSLCSIFTGTVVLKFLIGDSDSSGGQVGLAISQAFMMTGTLQWAIRQWAEIENTMTSVERVLEYTEVKQENKQGQTIEGKWPSRGEVRYENVYLSYNNSDDYVLRNINFTANPREKIGIVGRTGAGKSSIISTLFRLYEVQGRITIDGVDTKTLSLEFLRKHISIIPQDPVLFTGTIRDNIDPVGEYSDDEIWKAVEVSNLKPLVPSLDFKITENGSNFSIGQRQLICMARAVIQNNKIIVLDEATANMDPETDALIHETIKKNFESCTVFIIAHKLHSIINLDKVIVMDKGEIVQYDTPTNLLRNKNGPFHKMVQKCGLLPDCM